LTQGREGGRRTVAPGFVAEMQDATDEQGVSGFLPVIARPESLSFWIDHKESQVLDVANLVFGVDPELGNWIEATRPRGRGRLEAQHFVVGVLLAPAGAELVELAFEIGHEHAFGPRKESWDNQPNTFAAARGRVTQDMFRAVVPEVSDRSTFVAPGADIDTLVVEEPCGLYIAFVGPASGTVQERIDAETARKGEDQKQERTEGYHYASAEGLGEKRRIGVTPQIGPDEVGPGRIQMEKVRPQGRMKPKARCQELCGSNASEKDREEQPESARRTDRESVSAALVQLRPDERVPFQRSNP
jgi:hypothetical protein